MNYNELFFVAKRSDFHPVILSYADSTHYIIGHMTDTKLYDIAKDRHGKPICFSCLTEAKDALKSAGCTHTKLIMQTPYDEMIGQAESGECIMDIPLNKIS